MAFLASVTSWVFQQEVLGAISAAAAIWDAPNIRLFKAPYNPSPTDVLATYSAIECDYTGYALAAGGTWIPPALNANQQMCMQQPTVQFLASGTAVSNSVYGYFLTDTANTTLLYAKLLPTPVILGVNVLEALNLDAEATYGDEMPWASMLAILGALTPMTEPLNGAKMGLWQGSFSPGPGMLLADLTEATYDGYAKKTLATYLSPALDGDNNAVLQSATQQFAASGVTTPNTIGGLFVTNSAANKLLWAQQLLPTEAMAVDELHAINASPVLFLGS